MDEDKAVIAAMGLKFNNLKELHHCQFDSLFEVCIINRPNNLETLCLNHNKVVNDRYLESIATNCKALKNLDIGCKCIIKYFLLNL